MTTQTLRSPDEYRARIKAARNVRAMLEVASEIRAQMRQMADDEADNGDMSEASQQLFDALKQLLAELDGKLQRQATIDDMERRAARVPADRAEQQFERQCAEFSIRAAVAATIFPNVDAGREREVSQELARRSGRRFNGIAVPTRGLSLNGPMRDALGHREQRVISSTTPAAGPGGALIPLVLDPTQYIDVLRPAMVVRALGARVLSDLTANLDLPRMTGATSYGWFAENTAIPTSDETFDRVSLRPRHAGAILTVSRNMIQQSSPDIEAIIRDDLAQVLARAVDSAAIPGAGTAIEPLGIITDASVPSLPTALPASGAAVYDAIADLITLLGTANALRGSLGFLVNAALRGGLSKAKDAYGRPYLFDVLFQGYPYQVTNLALDSAGAHPIIFANWNDLVIGMWSEIDLLVNPYSDSAFSSGNVQLRGAMTIDVAKRQEMSFAWTRFDLSGMSATQAASGQAK